MHGLATAMLIDQLQLITLFPLAGMRRTASWLPQQVHSCWMPSTRTQLQQASSALELGGSLLVKLVSGPSAWLAAGHVPTGHLNTG